MEYTLCSGALSWWNRFGPVKGICIATEYTDNLYNYVLLTLGKEQDMVKCPQTFEHIVYLYFVLYSVLSSAVNSLARSKIKCS